MTAAAAGSSIMRTVLRQLRGSRAFSSEASAAAAAWWGKGLSFKCTECGKCCTGHRRAVYISDSEEQMIGSSLGLQPGEFASQYTRHIDGRLALKQSAATGDCAFLLNGKSCSIYSVRPAQCRTYPFWPEIVQSPHHWAAESARCEGIAPTKKLEQQPPAASPGAVVPHDEVLLNMIIEDVHRDGSGTTYDESRMLISALDEAPADGGDAAGDTPRSRSEAAPPGQRSALIEEYERDFFGSRRTEVRFESKRLKVLDVFSPESATRALVFQSSPDLTQSAFLLDTSSDPPLVRSDALCMEAHRALAMAAALAVAPPPGAEGGRGPASSLCVAVIGAGACALPLAFLHHLPSSSRIAAVDFDPEVLAVARSHFIAASLAAEGGGLRVAEGAVAAGLDAALAAAASRAAEGERGQPAATTVSETAASASHSAPRLALLQGDGAEFLSRSAEGAFDVIIVDCATGAGEEAGAGLQAPPPPLASSDALRALRRALAPGGVAAVNVFGERSAERGFEAAVAEAFRGGDTAAVDLPANTILFLRAPSAPGARSAPPRLSAAAVGDAVRWARRAPRERGNLGSLLGRVWEGEQVGAPERWRALHVAGAPTETR